MQQELNIALNSCPFPSVIIDEKCIIKALNNLALSEYFHHSSPVDQSIIKYFSLADKAIFNTLLSQPDSFHFYALLNCAEQSTKSVRINLSVIPGTYYRWLQFSYETNWRANHKNSERNLYRLERAVDGTDTGIWEYEINNKQGFFSPKINELLNIKKDETLTWKGFRSMIYFEDKAIFDIFFANNINQEIPLDFEFRVKIKGLIEWFHIKGEAIYEHEYIKSIMGSLTNSTEQKRILNALNDAIENKSIAMSAGKIGTWRAQLSTENSWDWDWDELANRMFGLKKEDIGDISKWVAGIHPDDAKRVASALDDSFIKGTEFNQRYRSIMPSGEVRYFVGHGIVRKNNLGEYARIDGICIDQSEVHQAQEQLKLLNNQLEQRVEQRTKELVASKNNAEQSSKIKSDFLSMMSHELRTPMNAVIGSLDLLATTEQNVESMELIDIAKTSAQNLVFILNDILDINKIEAGKLEINEESFSIGEVIDNVIKVFIPTAQKSKVKLQVYEDSSIPKFVKGDVMRLRQILFNLMGNALKFIDERIEKKPEVKLHASVIEKDDYVSMISFKIIDNGIGIDKAMQEKLFMPFIQAERSTTRKYGGTGLGLAICGKLTEMMGGSIQLTSTKGEGSCFEVNLPFWRSQETQALHVESLSTVEVQLIHFEQVKCNKVNSFKHYLEGEGANVSTLCYHDKQIVGDHFSVAFVLSSNTAKSEHLLAGLMPQLKQHKKVYLAVEDKYIKSMREQYPLTRVVSCQSLTSVQLRDYAYQAWQKSFELELGFDLADLEELEELEELEDEQVSFEDLSLDDLSAEQEGATNTKPPQFSSKNKLKTGILVVEDNPLNQKLIAKQLIQLGYDCALANDGEEGKSTWQNGNYKLILTDCHMPKLDGYEMTSAIREIERLVSSDPIPIIAVTGAAMAGDSNKCFDAGMNAFVSKPVVLSDLRKALKEWYPL